MAPVGLEDNVCTRAIQRVSILAFKLISTVFSGSFSGIPPLQLLSIGSISETHMNKYILILLTVLFASACGDTASKGKKGVINESDADTTQDAGFDSDNSDSDTDTGVEPDAQNDTAESACSLVDCFENSSCVVVDGLAVCECNTGFVSTGDACEPPNDAPILTNLPAQEVGKRGEGDTYQLTASDPNAGDTLSFALVSTTCPFDVQVIAESGVMTWQCPATTTSCQALLQVEDDAGLRDEKGLSIQCVRSLPVFDTTPSSQAEEGQTYIYDVQCNDPEGALVMLNVAAGDTCGGQIQNGDYRWTPSESQGASTCQLKLECTNGETTESQSATVTVAETNQAPVLSGVPGSQSTHWGQSNTYQVNATDADLPAQSLTFSRVSSNCGFTVNIGASGLISYQCGSTLGSCSTSIGVTDGFTTTTGSFTSSCTNTAPAVSNVSISPAQPTSPGQLLTCTYAFSDNDNDANLSTVEWLVNGVVVGTGTTFSNYSDADQIYCRVTPNDGVSTGTTKNSTIATAPMKLIVSGGFSHTCLRTQTGGVRCWGDNTDGRVGSNTSTSGGTYIPPTTPSGLTSGVTDISAGGLGTCAVQNGAVKCWGAGAWGMIGPGVSTDTITPTTIISSGVTQVAVGEVHVCAIQNGALKCWGANGEGQLGNTVGNNTTFGDNPTPTTVSGMSSGVTKVVAGQQHTCGIQNGALKCFGSNYFGQLGITSNVHSAVANPSATTVPGFSSGVTDVVAGHLFTCAVKTNVLYCWGNAQDDQLGYSHLPPDNYLPTAVTNSTGPYPQLTAGGGNVCYVQNGVAKCWGDNYSGQLAATSPTQSVAEIAVLGATVTSIEIGEHHVCAARGSTVYCWGNNYKGQLGTTTNYGLYQANPVPTIVTY